MPLSPALAAMRDALAAAEHGMDYDARRALRYDTSLAFGQARIIGWIAAVAEHIPTGLQRRYHLTATGRELLALLRGAS